MKISDMAYMGVESMIRLAAIGEDRVCPTQDIAQWLCRSESFTEILMARLHTAGLVNVKYGLGGGCQIARPANQITVAEIFQALSEPGDLPMRPLNSATFEAELDGSLRGPDLLWLRLKKNILLWLSGVSLADILPERNYSVANDEAESHPDFRVNIHSMATH